MTRAVGRIGLGAAALALGAAAFAPAPAAHPRITTDVTWNRDITRIVTRRCAPCHREGGAAPMALDAYDAARPWARAMREEVLERRMPPSSLRWGAGRFRNAPTLSPAEADLLVAWVDGGAPRGDGEPVEDHGGHAHGPAADAIVPLAAERTPVETAGEVRVSGVPPLDGVTGVRAWQFDPGGWPVRSATVHLGPARAGAWTPTERAVDYPDGVGLVLAGADHVAATLRLAGPPPADAPGPSVRLWWAKPPPRIADLRSAACDASAPLLADGVALLGLRVEPADPDARAIVDVILPDGRRDTLAEFGPPGVPDPAFYFLHEPVALGPGARLDVDASGPCRLDVAVAADAATSRRRGR